MYKYTRQVPIIKGDEKVDKLIEFMKGRPHNKDNGVIDYVMEYIEQVEDNAIRLSGELEHDR